MSAASNKEKLERAAQRLEEISSLLTAEETDDAAAVELALSLIHI